MSFKRPFRSHLSDVQLTPLPLEIWFKQFLTATRMGELPEYFFKWDNPGLFFCLFSSFSHYKFNTNTKSVVGVCLGLEPGLQDGRRRRNHGRPNRSIFLHRNIFTILFPPLKPCPQNCRKFFHNLLLWFWVFLIRAHCDENIFIIFELECCRLLSLQYYVRLNWHILLI